MQKYPSANREVLTLRQIRDVASISGLGAIWLKPFSPNSRFLRKSLSPKRNLRTEMGQRTTSIGHVAEVAFSDAACDAVLSQLPSGTTGVKATGIPMRLSTRTVTAISSIGRYSLTMAELEVPSEALCHWAFSAALDEEQRHTSDVRRRLAAAVPRRPCVRCHARSLVPPTTINL